MGQSVIDVPVLIVPGIGNSGPQHWQTLWEGRHSNWSRVQQRDWDHPVCDEWVGALDEAIAACPAPPVLIAHSIGCLVVVHWASRFPARVRAALLVAVPDPRGPNFPATAEGFAPLPLVRLGFPSLVLASTDDPFGSIVSAQCCAEAWGSQFINIGSAGHVNVESGHGDWPAGYLLLEGLLQSLRPHMIR